MVELCLVLQPAHNNLQSYSGVTLVAVTAHVVLVTSGAQDSSGNVFSLVINTDTLSVPICSSSLTSLGCHEDKYLNRLSQTGHQSDGEHKRTGYNRKR